MTEKDRKYVCVGLGEILWDMLPDGKQLGGAPANFAYHAQALGANAVVVSCVGDDELGKEILSRLEQLSLERNYIAIDKYHPTGTVTVELDENGKPDYTIHQDVAWDFIPSDAGLADLAARADAVCFGSLCQRSPVSRQTVRDFLRATRPDCIRIFDINIRQSYFDSQIVHAMLQLSNVLKLNDEELPVVAGLLGLTGNISDVLSQLTSMYSLRMIALTRGPNGSCLYTRRQVCSHRGFPAQVADTVGAGDSFAAAIALGMLHGRTLAEINEFANRVASFVCSQPGATPKLPDALAKKFGLS
ncbi:MAG TPA: carbohydrate kinase [Sedimentisphaerales bacterium]|nr:carbohydrate kinase [Sedimentisphaerales bacterium]